MSGMWRRALIYTVTVKRSSTATSASGATKFVYDQVIATGLAASIQSGSGSRMKQDDVGQLSGRKHSAIFGEEAIGLLKQNDIITVAQSGETFKLYHVHEVLDPNAPHVECDVESWVPAGGD